MIMAVTIKQLKLFLILSLFSPVFCWAKTDITSIYQEVSNNRAILIDARQGTQSGETSVLGAHWVKWPQSTHELPMLFDQLASLADFIEVHHWISCKCTSGAAAT
jgi:hypothetical protein